MQRKVSLLALGISLVAAMLLLWMLGHAPSAQRSIVVTTRDIAPGEPLVRAALDFRDVPEAYLEERHIGGEDVERLIGMRTTHALSGGASLLWSDLDANGQGRTLSGLVQVGMRALSLPERELGFEGLLRPGDRVDVLFTPRVPDDGSPDEQPSLTLLENALVLSVGHELARAREGEGGRVALSVSPRDALRVAHSQGRGSLSLSVRNPHDVAVAEVFEGQVAP